MNRGCQIEESLLKEQPWSKSGETKSLHSDTFESCQLLLPGSQFSHLSHNEVISKIFSNSTLRNLYIKSIMNAFLFTLLVISNRNSLELINTERNYL